MLGDIDFPLVLVVLTFVTGLVWALDKWVLSPKRDSDDKPNVVVENCRSFFPVLAVVLVLRSFLVEPFQIPSGSMLPTLEVGDFILVNKYTYGLRLPVAGTKVLELGDPERGDIMVFKFPQTPKINFIKRVVAVPGDVVVYKNKQLSINGKVIQDTALVKVPPMRMFQTQSGNTEHKIFKNIAPNQEGSGEWKVPAGQYFVMGDNRDNSNDSRFWGFVPDEFVVGRAFWIWMHWECLTCIPSFGRFGSID